MMSLTKFDKNCTFVPFLYKMIANSKGKIIKQQFKHYIHNQESSIARSSSSTSDSESEVMCVIPVCYAVALYKTWHLYGI